VEMVLREPLRHTGPLCRMKNQAYVHSADPDVSSAMSSRVRSRPVIKIHV
jgi:hypothetical protein